MMRLEDIAQRIDRIKVYALDEDSEEEKQLLLRDIDAAIAERALPVTREWLGAMFGGTDLPGHCFVHERDGEWRFLIRTGSVGVNWDVAKITTRGQLLDLLSGLGVRK